MSRKDVSLIFDIGKTTKKVLLFDQNFHVVLEKTERFSEVADDDGFPAEDIGLLSKWIKDSIQYYSNHSDYQVTHINFSAYGASLVHLSDSGEVIKPFYNYLKHFPEDCKEKFLNRYDIRGDLCAVTASPFLGLLNSGLQLFWMKFKKNKAFKQIKTSLHFPQYFAYLATGKLFSDITSVGCHTLLWDFAKHDYHEWVDKEHLRKLFPPIQQADYTIDHVVNKISIKVGIGVHDSSASLMPYLAVMKEKFLLLSTGTWNICFNPFNQDILHQDELAQDCLCFLTFDGKPVKASRIFLGHEHEMQQNAMAAYYKVDANFYTTIDFNSDLYKKIGSSKPHFAPLGMSGTGPFIDPTISQTDYASFSDFEEAQHQLIRQLVLWQKISIDLIDPLFKVKNIIVVGGFTKSKLFLEIMKLELKEREILISDHPRAAALGAAWLVCGKSSYATKDKLLNVLKA